MHHRCKPIKQKRAWWDRTPLEGKGDKSLGRGANSRGINPREYYNHIS